MSLVDSGYELSVLKGEDRGRVVPLKHKEIHLGRTSAEHDPNWIYFSEPTVSRHHASLVWDEKRRHYSLQHKSQTNPTLVNGKKIRQCSLVHDDIVQLGLLIFKVAYVGTEHDSSGGTREETPSLERGNVEREKEPERERTSVGFTPPRPSSTVASPTTPVAVAKRPEFDGDEDEQIVTGLKLVATAGPDRGSVYLLDKNVLFIGRREGLADLRGNNGILLNDDGLPKEQVLLAWNEREQTYGIFQVESSVLPTRIHRAVNDDYQTIQLSSNMQALLKVGDLISMGETALRLCLQTDSDEEVLDLEDPRPKATAFDSFGRPINTHQTVAVTLPAERRGFVPGGRKSEPEEPPRSGLAAPASARGFVPGGFRKPEPEPAASEPAAPPSNRGFVPGGARKSEPEPAAPESQSRGFVPGSTFRKPEPSEPAPGSSFRKPESSGTTAGSSFRKPESAPPPEEPKRTGFVPGGFRKPEASPAPPQQEASMERRFTSFRKPEPSEAMSSDKTILATPAEIRSMRSTEAPPKPPAPPAPPRVKSSELPTVEPTVPKAPPSLPARPPIEPPAESSSMRNRLPEPGPAKGAGALPAVGGVESPLLPSMSLTELTRGLRDIQFTDSLPVRDEPDSGEVDARQTVARSAIDGGQTLKKSAPSNGGGEDAAWHYRADYVITFLEGKNKGQVIEFQAAEVVDGHLVTVGSRGERTNDIEINDPNVSNAQATITFGGGRFNLCNQGKNDSIFINDISLKNGEEFMLKTGDRIGLGESILVYLERAVVQTLSRYEVVVQGGVPEDKGKVFDLLKEQVLVGKLKSCDVSLADTEVSRKHLHITLKGGRFYAIHQSATGSTAVNGIPLARNKERQLNEGDKIQLSDATVLIFRAKAVSN